LKQVLKIGLGLSLVATATLVGLEKGFFKKYGLTVDVVKEGGG